MRLALPVLALLLASGAAAQPAAPPEADPADVGTTHAILAAVYASISGPADEPRDWDRFRSLMHPAARLIPIGQRPDSSWAPVVIWSVEDYVAYGTQTFRDAPLFQGKGFYEVEAAQRTERYEHLAHVWSTYESRLDPAEAPFARGINSFQLTHDGARWWVLSITWEQESALTPIPAPYLPE